MQFVLITTTEILFDNIKGYIDQLTYLKHPDVTSGNLVLLQTGLF